MGGPRPQRAGATLTSVGRYRPVVSLITILYLGLGPLGGLVGGLGRPIQPWPLVRGFGFASHKGLLNLVSPVRVSSLVCPAWRISTSQTSCRLPCTSSARCSPGVGTNSDACPRHRLIDRVYEATPVGDRRCPEQNLAALRLRSADAHFHSSSRRRTSPVWLRFRLAIVSGVPWATTRPPPEPPSGPRSTIQSAASMTSG